MIIMYTYVCVCVWRNVFMCTCVRILKLVLTASCVSWSPTTQQSLGEVPIILLLVRECKVPLSINAIDSVNIPLIAIGNMQHACILSGSKMPVYKPWGSLISQLHPANVDLFLSTIALPLHFGKSQSFSVCSPVFGMANIDFQVTPCTKKWQL